MKTYNIKRIILLLAILGVINIRTNAQNTGPVAPEAMQFEPVDATDMVNLLTGDFSYVLPLLEVPGPSGGYPIALSYHGGVTMDQEASWVGLGWNINPGAINRNVNGIPDDFNGVSGLGIVYDDGGTYTSNFVSVYLPIDPLPIGISVSWGSSWSISGSIGMGGLGFGSDGLSVSGVIPETNLGISVSSDVVAIGGGVGPISGTFNSNGEWSIGAEVRSLGVSLSSSGTSLGLPMGRSVSMGGAKNPLASSNNIFTNTSQWMVPLILINFGHSKSQWCFYDDNESINYGALNLQDSEKENQDPWRYSGIQDENSTSDVYSIYSSEEEYLRVDKEDTKNNMVFPAYDYYSVNAQGINGSIVPKIFDKGLLFGNNKVLNEFLYAEDAENYYDRISSEVMYHYEAGEAFTSDIERKLSTLEDNINPYFYFEGTSSGWIQVFEGQIELDGTEKDPVWGEYKFTKIPSGSNYIDYSTNSDATLNRRADGNFVEYFTNSEILTSPANAEARGFIEADCPGGIDRSNSDLFDADGIGAFVVTATDGMKYHYSLPVYQFEEFITNQEYGSEDFYLNMQDKYAYSWLLTAITGPDYYDVGDNGFGNEDYGYWVEFKYGKWTDGYVWKTPYEITETYKWGRKQIYYLNSIETKTHKAYFVKELREDGLGAKQINFDKNFQVIDDEHHALKIPEVLYDIETEAEIRNNEPTAHHTIGKLRVEIDINGFSKHKVLRLSKILLFNKDVNLNPQNNTNFISSEETDIYYKNIYEDMGYAILIGDPSNYHHYYEYYDFAEPDGYQDYINTTYTSYYQNNVIDIYDLEDANIENQALKIIDFNYDDSDPLCMHTPNSELTNNGKLTLKSVQMLGEGGVITMPAYNFEYYKLNNNEYSKDNINPWGFDREYPENWSLKTITTPLGGKINIEYESDSYHTMAAFGELFRVMHIDEIKSVEANNLVCFKIPEMYAQEDFTQNVTEILVSGKYLLSSQFFPVNTSATASFYSHSNGYIYLNNFDFEDDALDGSIINDIENIHLKISYNKNEQQGGGLRVHRISLENEAGDVHTTEYNYTDPTSGITYGITTYEPFSGKTFIPYITEIPGPGVCYEYVTKKDFDSEGNSLGTTVYNFEVPEISSNPYSNTFAMGTQFSVTDATSILEPDVDGDGHKKVDERHSLIKNKTSQIGRLKSVKTYNNETQLLSSTENVYCEESELPGGIDQETFYHLKNVRTWPDVHHDYSDNQFYFNVSSRIEFPSVLKETITRSGNQTSTTYYDDFDPYTGVARSIRTVQTDGKGYKSVSIPAYTLDAYSGDITTQGMGSKMVNPNNANMLTQEAASYTYLNTSTTGEDWLPIGAAVQTWKGDWGSYWHWDSQESNFVFTNPYPAGHKEWRKYQNYVWNGSIGEDGTYSWTKTGDDFDQWFNFDGTEASNVSNGWVKTLEIKRYNLYSSVVESKDIYGRFASSKHDENNQVICSAANASFLEFAYSGAEEEILGNMYFTGGVKKGNNAITTVPENVHTGYRALATLDGDDGFVYETRNTSDWLPAKRFLMQVWVKGNVTDDMLRCSAGTPEEQSQFTAKDWTLLSRVVNVSISIGSTVNFYCHNNSGSIVYFDDFKVQPLTASVAAYNYDEQGNVITVLGDDNIATTYKYDEAGRLIETNKETPEGFKQVSEHEYNYKRSGEIENFDINGLTIFCTETSLDFSVSNIVGGTSPYTYSWNVTPNASISGSTSGQSVIVSGIVGSFYVSCFITDSKNHSLELHKFVQYNAPNDFELPCTSSCQTNNSYYTPYIYVDDTNVDYDLYLNNSYVERKTSEDEYAETIKFSEQAVHIGNNTFKILASRSGCELEKTFIIERIDGTSCDLTLSTGQTGELIYCPGEDVNIDLINEGTCNVSVNDWYVSFDYGNEVSLNYSGTSYVHNQMNVGNYVYRINLTVNNANHDEYISFEILDEDCE